MGGQCRPTPGEGTEDQRLFVRLFGGVSIKAASGASIDMANERMRLLIGYVCLDPDRAHDRDEIGRILWPGRFPSQAKGSLRQCLYDLGKLLDPVGGTILKCTRTAISLDRSRATVDLDLIETALADGDFDTAAHMLGSSADAPLLALPRGEAKCAGDLSEHRFRVEERLREALIEGARHAREVQSSAADALAKAAIRRQSVLQGAAVPSSRTDAGLTVGSYSVAVLPFEHDGSASLADEIGRELTQRLARSPHLYVAAFEPWPPRSDQRVDIVSASCRFGVRYLVCGAIVDGRQDAVLRLSLINADSRQHLWSKRILLPETAAKDLKFVADLTTAVLSEIQIAEGAALGGASSDPVRDYEVVLKTEMLRRVYSRDRAREIVTYLSDVVARDPVSSTGHAYLGSQLAQNVVSQFCDDFAADERGARAHAEAALLLAPLATDVLVTNGIVNAMLGDCPAAVRFLERACEANADDPHTLAMLGWQRCWLHADPGSIDLIRQAEACAPHHPRMANWAHYRAVSLLKVGRLEEALDAHQECYDRNPNYHYPMVFGAALLAHMGRNEEARAVLSRALRMAPYFDIDRFLRKPADFPYCWNDGFTAEHARTAVRRIWCTLAQS